MNALDQTLLLFLSGVYMSPEVLACLVRGQNRIDTPCASKAFPTSLRTFENALHNFDSCVVCRNTRTPLSSGYFCAQSIARLISAAFGHLKYGHVGSYISRPSRRRSGGRELKISCCCRSGFVVSSRYRVTISVLRYSRLRTCCNRRHPAAAVLYILGSCDRLVCRVRLSNDVECSMIAPFRVG